MGWRADGGTRVETIGVEVEETRYSLYLRGPAAAA
jgi:hypothetical protein